MQGAKYKRRWVEVTEHTFVYSPSQQDALTGRCSVFAVGDMVWVKADGDTKFMVRGSWRHLCLQLPVWPDIDNNAASETGMLGGC